VRASHVHLRSVVVLVGVVTVLCVAASWAGPVDTHSLIRNGDFEQGDGLAGWTPQAGTQASYSITSNALTGRQALKIAVPTPGKGAITSAPCRVVAGSDYLHRAEGMSTRGNRYEGCAAGMNILWQDAAGKEVGRDLCSMPYGPVPDYRAATYRACAPAGAVQVRLQMYVTVAKQYKGPPTAVFLDTVRFMKLASVAPVPQARRWVYLNRKRGSGLQIVPDKDALNGKAVLAAVGKASKNAGLTWGQYTSEQPVGDYLAVFRLKVKDNTSDKPAAALSVSAYGNLSHLAPQKLIRASDFKAPGVYQEFAVRFIRPEEGVLEFSVSFGGATDLWFDKTTVVQLASFPTDREQAAIWLGEGAYAAAPALPAGQRRTILVLKGLGNQVYLPDQANWKPPGAVVKEAYVARRQTGFVLDEPFPKSLAALKDVKVIVLADVPASALNGLMGRRTLRQFVESGGSLCVFGGPLAYGKGELIGSALEDVLPVTITGPWDLVRATVPTINVSRRSSTLTRGLSWNKRPLIYYYHKVAARPQASILLECEGNPLLVTGYVGKGKVALFMGTYLGEPRRGETFFYRWADYPVLLGRTLQWLFASRND